MHNFKSYHVIVNVLNLRHMAPPVAMCRFVAPNGATSKCCAMWRIVAQTKLNCGATCRQVAPHLIKK